MHRNRKSYFGDLEMKFIVLVSGVMAGDVESKAPFPENDGEFG